MTDIDFRPLMEPAARILLGEPNMARSKFPTDMRWGTHGSLSGNFTDGIFFNHETGQGGGVVEFIHVHTGADGMSWLEQNHLLNGNGPKLPPLPSAPLGKSRNVVKTYDYKDENGQLLFQVVRYEPKEFRQRRPAKENGKMDLESGGDAARSLPASRSE